MQALASTPLVQPPNGGEIHASQSYGADQVFPRHRRSSGEPIQTNEDAMAFGHVFQQPLAPLNTNLNAPSTDVGPDFMTGNFFDVYYPMSMATGVDAPTHLGFGRQY